MVLQCVLVLREYTPVCAYVSVSRGCVDFADGVWNNSSVSVQWAHKADKQTSVSINFL